MRNTVENENLRNNRDLEDRSKNSNDQQATSQEEVEFDQLISAAGEIGVYQIYLTFLTFPFYIFGVCSYFGQLFMTEASQNHWCWVPELENFTSLERQTLAIPRDENARFGYSQCEMYAVNWTEVLSSGMKPNQSWPTQRCQHGWEFDKTDIPYPTITSEMGWVCDKSSYQATAQATFFVGSVVGGFLLGWISDRYGRLPAAVVSNVIGCVAGIISIFAKNFIQFCLCRLLMGLSYDSCMMMMYLLVLEFMAPKYRSIMANLPFGVFYSIAATTLPWVALACGHWKIISLATSLPMALALLAPLIVPESPRWLLTKGRVDEAVDKIIKVSRVNKNVVPTKLIDQFKESYGKKEITKSQNLLDIIKKPVLRKIFICLSIEYMSCMIVYDALVRSLGTLNFDFFVSFSLVSVTEFPSLLIISFILDLTGRKWLTILCMLVCCLLSVITAFLSGGLPSVLCAVAARFAVNMCVNIALQWGAEMLPTSIRGSGASFIHICGYIATILSPYIVYLNNYFVWLPQVILAVIAVIGATAAVMLPETAGKEMPQSFEDAENLIANQKIFDIPCLQRKTSRNIEGQVNSSFEMN